MQKVVETAAANVHSKLGGPFAAAVIVSATGEVVSMTGNRVFTQCDPTAHAEVTAIREACKAIGQPSLAGHTLLTSCYPCPMCYGAIRWAGLDAIYYGATPDDAARIAGFADEDMYREIRKEVSPPIPIVHWSGTLKTGEAVDVNSPFKAWAAFAEKQHYGPVTAITGEASAKHDKWIGAGVYR